MILTQWRSASLQWKQQQKWKDENVCGFGFGFFCFSEYFYQIANVPFFSLPLNSHMNHWCNDTPYLQKRWKDAFIQDHPKRPLQILSLMVSKFCKCLCPLCLIYQQNIFSSPLLFSFQVTHLGYICSSSLAH